MKENKTKRKHRRRNHYGEDYQIISEKRSKRESTNICDTHIDGA